MFPECYFQPPGLPVCAEMGAAPAGRRPASPSASNRLPRLRFWLAAPKQPNEPLAALPVRPSRGGRHGSPCVLVWSRLQFCWVSASRSRSRARIWPRPSRRTSRRRRSTAKTAAPAPPSRVRKPRPPTGRVLGVRERPPRRSPGAPADSQTVPSKFSERNAALDELPTMAFPLPLTDEQRQRIREAVSQAPVEGATARVPPNCCRAASTCASCRARSRDGDSGGAQPRLCAHRRQDPADQPAEPDRRRRDRKLASRAAASARDRPPSGVARRSTAALRAGIRRIPAP